MHRLASLVSFLDKIEENKKSHAHALHASEVGVGGTSEDTVQNVLAILGKGKVYSRR